MAGTGRRAGVEEEEASLVWSVATVASGLAPTYALLLVARAVIGAAEASHAVVTPSVLSDRYPPDRRAHALGVFHAAIPIGTALGYGRPRQPGASGP